MSEKTKPTPITGYSDKAIALIRNVGSQLLGLANPPRYEASERLQTLQRGYRRCREAREANVLRVSPLRTEA